MSSEKTELFWKAAGSLMCVPVGHVEIQPHNIPSIFLTDAGKKILGTQEIVMPGTFHHCDPATGEDTVLGYSCGSVSPQKQGVLFTRTGIEYSNQYFNKRPLEIVTVEKYLAPAPL